MSLRRWQLTIALPFGVLGMAVYWFAYATEGTLQTFAQVVGLAYIGLLILVKRWLDRRFTA